MSSRGSFVDGNVTLLEHNTPEQLTALGAAMAAAHKEQQLAARRMKLEMLADAISLMIDAKIVESRGFAKWNTVSDARQCLIDALKEVV